MRVVIQRVQKASVEINHAVHAEIKQGYLVLVGIHKEDSINDTIYLADKILSLRIFPDLEHKMNLDIKAVQGSLLVVSQFTLYANTAGGNRPDFIQAAPPEQAQKLYQAFIDRLKKGAVPVVSGIFGANMQVTLTNDGPVTIIMDSR
ncbi:MAG: D-aminoacyl-tRNA deacylase [bacterium]|nr:D-aminoacyl-tRNA deacylase [bacterium]MDD5353920.1 D-aminoacyl-tRNA deacylase [bacterium]MDD5755769.1 D-aminoacyl-tRNA deacylase [bacterium]